MYSVELDLMGLPAMNTASNRNRWVVNKNKKVWQEAMGWATRNMPPPDEPLEYAFLVCTRHSSVEPDYDNLVHSFKPLVDYFVIHNYIVDDKISNLSPLYAWQKTRKSMGRVTIALYSEPPA